MISVTPNFPLADTDGCNTFVLRRLDVFNWGAFCGLHSVDIDPQGTAVVGVTGSGKTTLIDALMTLLAEKPHYNLASSGGHDPDRSLSAYVRGEPGQGSTLPQGRRKLRPGMTTSGLCARFDDGDQSLCLAALFWYASSEELHRAWICSQSLNEPLEYWLTLYESSGFKGLKRLERDVPGLQVTASKQEYLSFVRRFFDVSDNAFTLLSRAVGVKQLDNVNDLFRKLVLEDVSRFEAARAVADDFNTLIEIHGELALARAQVQCLEPVATLFTEHRALTDSLGRYEQLHRILPIWYAMHEHRLLTAKIRALDDQLAAQDALISQIQSRIQHLRTDESMLRERFVRAGGTDIERVTAHFETQRKVVANCTRSAAEYSRLATSADLDAALDADVFAKNQAKLQMFTERAHQHHCACREAAGLVQAKLLNVQRARDDVFQEHEQMKSRPSSNIPVKEQCFRATLGQILNLDDSLLPFAGELIQVKPEETMWRGAIERAIGGHRYRIMIPAKSLPLALDWVNRRHHDIHVRLQEVRAGVRPPEFMPDGFTAKLQYKQHPYREAVQLLLAKIDRHCVGTTAELHATPFSLTREGLMSGAHGQFEKQDQKQLHRDWVTGFSNQDRLSALQVQLQTFQCDLDEISKQLELADQVARQAEGALTALKSLARFRFDDIDTVTNQLLLDQLETQVASLSAPQSETECAKNQWEQAKALLAAAAEKHESALLKRKEVETHRESASHARTFAVTRMGSGLTDLQFNLASAHLTTPADEEPDPREIEAQAQRRIHNETQAIGQKLGELEKRLVHLMAKAKQIDNGPLAEVGVTIEDLPAYVARLRMLAEEALPAKQKRFLVYLNNSSDQQVTTLLSDIENEVARIEERVTDLSNTLQRVDFRPGTFIRLVPQRVVHERLRALHQAQKNIRSSLLKQDGGESHFKALKELIAILRDASEHTTSDWAKALLDPRYRLQFAVALTNRVTQEVLQLRTGSQGDSGGEKESIASFVLISSLGYALCPSGRTRPLFGTVVLDEAFSKTSSDIGNAIMTALHEFGLHPLLVTPNKEFRLLRQHTKTAIVVQHHDGRSTTSWFTWEMLDAMYARRQAHLRR